MTSISLCMIVKNEEKTIARCLDSVKHLVDEIIIVDTGSTDKTKEIITQYTDRVLDFEWIEDFAAARNFAFQHATMKYIFWLDADDVLSPCDAEKFRALKETLDESVDSVTMNYHLAFDVHGNLTSSLRRNRLVKRSNNFQWVGAVHEYLGVWGNIFNSDVAVTHVSIEHDSDRNLNIYLSRLSRDEEFSPRDLYYFANELKDHSMYEKAIEYYQKFMDTRKGWVEDNISACGKVADCFHHLGDPERALEYALKAFHYDKPRSDFCCRIGFHFMQQERWAEAVFWYNLAVQIGIPQNSWGSINYACATWLPHLQLCVCYDRLGEYDLAYEHNEKAGQYIPEDTRILHNKRYFERIRGGAESH